MTDKTPGDGDDGSNYNTLEDRKFAAHDEDFSGANDEARAILLASLELEHRDLDSAILAVELATPYERLTIARLKKKKLHLKDKIGKLKDDLFPDIIA